jgi:enamine deaminase RidA (YjgF/YER057c/UK114 family)
MSKIEQRLSDLGILLPVPAMPVANYVGWQVVGTLVFTSGQLAMVDGVLQHPGLLGDDVDLKAGYQAARICAINAIAQLGAAAGGDLDRIVRIVKLTGFVASNRKFTDQPKVVNGASDLFVEVFGDVGLHARSAVGVAVLPLNASVEVEAIAEVR